MTRLEVPESTLELLDPRPLALRHKLGLLGLIIVAIAPLYLGRTDIIRLTGALFLGMWAMSWDSVSGYTGEISFGHAFFFAIGGYTSALLNLEMGIHPALGILAGALLAGIGGLLIGVPALRISGPYLSLVTLVAPLILFQLFVIFSGVFGGETGLRNPEYLVPLSGLARDIAVFYLSFAMFLLVLFGLLLIMKSNAGAVFLAIREGEEIVAATGKNPAKFKIFAFVLSGIVGGFAGAGFVHTAAGQATPSELLVLEISVIVIVASVIGGIATIYGAAIGGMFVYLLENAVINQIHAPIPVVGVQVSELSFLLLGVIGLLILYYLPGGMVRWAIERGREIDDRYRGDYDTVIDRAVQMVQNRGGDRT